MPTHHELYKAGKALANALGRSDSEVPLPYQLNELEDYVAQAHQELAEREAANAADIQAAIKAGADEPTTKR